ncbi:MAG: hypothetical protein IKL14_03080 [Alphaproteobacteria bacterium]|nr:hypothetical protein [Alphaproteobacteria bacterium]
MNDKVEQVFLETVAKVVVNGDIDYVLENKEEDRFLEAIGAESLDNVKLVMALEDTFDINITDEELEDFVKMSCDEMLHMLESAGASAESMRRARAQKETPKPVADKKHAQESSNPGADKKQAQKSPNPGADKKQVQESPKPVADKKQAPESSNPGADKKQAQESSNPGADKKQAHESPNPGADKKQAPESSNPGADKKQAPESSNPGADKKQAQESQKTVADKKQAQESQKPVADKEQTQKMEFKTILHKAENLVASIKLFESAQNNITAPSKQQPKPAIELRTMKDGKPYCELLGKKCNRPERPNNTGKVYCEFMNCRIYNNFQRLR